MNDVPEIDVRESNGSSAPSTAQVAAALAEARKEFADIKRDRTVTVKTQSGSSYDFSYAPFESLVAATSAALAKHGLSVVQSAAPGLMVSRLVHSSGEELVSRVPLVIPDKARPQEVGSALTYARRYGYSLLLCLAADDDDDGNLAEGNAVTRKGRGTGKPASTGRAASDGGGPPAPDPDSMRLLADCTKGGDALGLSVAERRALKDRHQGDLTAVLKDLDRAVATRDAGGDWRAVLAGVAAR